MEATRTTRWNRLHPGDHHSRDGSALSDRMVNAMTTRNLRIRKPHNATMPYKLLTILLYGRFRWLHRDGNGWVRCTTRQMCIYLKTEPDHLKGCLQSLENWGVIRKFSWWKSYWEVHLEIPVDMAIYKPAITLVPSESAPEIFEMLAQDPDELEATRNADPSHILNNTIPGGEDADLWPADIAERKK